MNVGEKIRALRQSKMMTQAELAGTKITRNMLSCIENGAAQPSLSTVVYLAERLGVPVGFLLAEEREEPFYRKMNRLENIKRALREQDWEGCKRMCLSVSGEPLDDELCMLVARSNLGIAEETFWQGKLHTACRYFDEAIAYDRKTLYSQPMIEAVAAVYFRFMRRISPTLFSENADDEGAAEMVLKTPFSAYTDALEALDRGDISLAERFSDDFPQPSFFATHLRAKVELTRGKNETAKQLLQGLLDAPDTLLNEVQLYEVLTDLEIACRETEDYKGAYRYANERVQLQEQLLKDG